MNINVPPPAGAVPWEQVRTRLDQNGPFANMYDTPLYRDAVWEQFSEAEYARRYAALRAKDARAQARRRDRAGRPEPLEFRRRHDLAHRPLGMARARRPTCWSRSTTRRR